MPIASGRRAAATGPPRAGREGADAVGPEARRPPSDRKAGKPSRKGVAHHHAQARSSRPGGRPRRRRSSRRRRRSPADRQPSGSKGAGDTLLERTAVTTDDRTFTKDGAAQRARTSAGGALERAAAIDVATRATGVVRRLQITDDPGRDAHFAERATYVGRVLVDSGSTTSTRAAGVCSDADAGRRRRPVLVDQLLRVRQGADAAADRLELHGADGGARAPRRQSRVTRDGRRLEFTRRRRSAPAAGASVSAGGHRSRRARDGIAHVTAARRARRRRRTRGASRNGFVAHGDRAGVRALRARRRRRPGRRPAAPDTRGAGDDARHRDGQVFSRQQGAARRCAARSTPDPSGPAPRSSSASRAASARRCCVLLRRGASGSAAHALRARRSFFKIGDRADWSYLLPERLGARALRARGLRAIDGAVQPRRRAQAHAGSACAEAALARPRRGGCAARRPGARRGGDGAADGGRQGSACCAAPGR